ncbi:hypothetical protein LNV08_17270 [Paucibacter sp. TC2R-5]|uniref:hypothetical protein n=1 Tax=Paucibacter sp. TC2R-5 TaxID=2893555 RepID=UPI0021E45358|nr:hypothetical protein [Paucibacter sp. TC2R-5]MCV2360725.1 hypothetical protein [Paucibacter sp. TC2R-5]
MKLAVTLSALLAFASLAGSACSMDKSARPAQIELGQSFSLRPGEVVQATDALEGSAGTATEWAGLRIGFEGVSADSRCPKGEQCMWAGDATVRVWLQQGTGPKELRELNAAEGPAQTAYAYGYALRLLSLAPYPVSGKPIAAGDYVLTLKLRRGESTSTER